MAERKLRDGQELQTEGPWDMAFTTDRYIVNVDRMKDGIILKFDDGRCAFYPCAFLYAKIAECEELDENNPRW